MQSILVISCLAAVWPLALYIVFDYLRRNKYVHVFDFYES
jgi:hypothetical protein